MASPANSYIKCVTYNMHGFNQGVAMLHELCLSYDIILCQEHWLLTSQLEKISNLSSDFHCVSVSSMDDICGRGVLRGRPFGGLATFVRKSVSNKVQHILKTDRIIGIKVGHCIFINVYFPVYTNSSSYQSEVDCLLSELYSVICDNNQCSVILAGDFNLNFVDGKSRSDAVNKFVSSANLRLCDNYNGDTTSYTYICESRNAVSFIDHFFVSDHIYGDVKLCSALDSGLNFSDHFPLELHINIAHI